MSRITQIRDVAASSKGNLSDALLQCLVLADELEYAPLGGWANLELSGYQTLESLPDFRKTHSSLMGTLFEGNRYTCGYTIPDLWIDEEYRENALTVYVYDGIYKLQTLPDDGSMGVSSVYHNWIEGTINNKLREDYGPFAGVRSVALSVPPGTYARVIGAVQQSIVRFMIELNRMYPSDEEIQAESGEHKPQLDLVFTNIVSIEKVDNLVLGGTVSEVQQTSNVTITINPGDFESLAAYLRSISVSENTIRELEPIANDLARGNTSEQVNRSFTEWMGNAVNSAPAVAGDVATEASKQAAASGIIEGVIRFAPNVTDWINAIALQLPF